MRYIAKEGAPQALEEWQVAHPGEGYKEFYVDPDAKAARDGWRSALLREQGHVCAYCGVRIDPANRDCHLDHVVPQTVDSARTLEHANVVLSCQGGNTLKTPGKSEHCGHNRSEGTLLDVSPLERDCEACFRYDESGAIYPAGSSQQQGRAAQAIGELGLSAPALRRAREKAVKEVISETVQSEMDQAAIHSRIDTFRSRDDRGRHAPYSQAILSVLEQL